MPSSLSSRLIALYRARPQLCAATLLLLLTCIVRLPFLHVVSDDEPFYSAVASRWLRGELPYVASFDIKAPGLFALLAFVQALFGANFAVVKGLEIVFTAAGAWGLYRLLARYGSGRAAICASVLYPVYSLILMGVSAPCQVVQATLTIWAFVLAFDSLSTGRWTAAAVSGLMIGLAITVKQTAAFEAIACLGILAWRLRTWKPVLAFAVAVVAPTLGFAAYFVATGHFHDAFADVVTLAGQRSQIGSQPSTAWYLDALARMEQWPLLFVPLLVAICGVVLALVRRERLNAPLALPVVDLTLVWYAAAAAGMLVIRSPEDWYAAPLIAPSLILFAMVLCDGIAFTPRARPVWTAVFAGLAVIQPLAFAAPSLAGESYRGPPDWRGDVLAAQGLVAAGLQPTDNLLVPSRGLSIYLLTGALPRARYFHAMHLLCRFPTPDADPLGAAFATRPKFVVMSDTKIAMGCTDKQQVQRIRAILAADYVPIKTVTGTWDQFALYRLR